MEFSARAWLRCFFLGSLSSASLIDLSSFTSLDVANKQSLSLQWEVRVDASLTAAPALLVEGPTTLVMPPTVEADPSRESRALLTLAFACGDQELNIANTGSSRSPTIDITSSTTSSTPNYQDNILGTNGASRRARLQPSLLLTLFSCLLFPLFRSHKIAIVALVIFAVSLPGHIPGGWACGGTVKLTLLVKPDQWATVDSCGNCPPDVLETSRHFVWRPPCDVAAAAAAYDAAATSCERLPCSDEAWEWGCGVFGFCSGYIGPPSADDCSRPNAAAQNCAHSYFEARVTGNASRAGADWFRQDLSCMADTRPVEGRPYTTDRGSVIAPASCSKTGAWGDTQVVGSDASPNDWSSLVAATVADAWLHHGQEEHASIASFARFSLDLLRFGAPPHLLLAAQAAGADEVRHAQRSFGLSAYFGGTSDSMSVSQFPIDTVELSPTLGAMASRTLLEGCAGESAAVARLAYAIHQVSGSSPARPVLEELLVDEASHAALAWNTVSWAVGKGARDDIAFRKRFSSSPRRQQPALMPAAALTWGGRIPEDVAAELMALVEERWVQPWLSAIVEGRRVLPNVVTTSASSLDAALAEAVKLVRSRLEAHELEAQMQV